MPNNLLNASVTDSERLTVLYEADILDTPSEEIFDNLTERLCQDLNVPVSLLSIVDFDRQFFKSLQGLPEGLAKARSSPRDYSICQYVVDAEDIIAIGDASKNPVFENHPAVKDWGIAAYLGAPVLKNGKVLGSLCAIDYSPRERSDSDIKLIKNRAEFIKNELHLRDECKSRGA